MAIAQYSGIGITEMRNKLGGEVHTRNRSGQVTRAYVIPTNTITAARTAVRNNFSTCISLWQAVNQEEVIQWNLFGMRFTKRNAIAQSYKLTGRQIFFLCNLNLLQSGLFPISAPVFNELCFPVEKAQVAVLSAIDIQIAIKFLPASYIVPLNHVLSVSASPSVSPGINYPRNNFLQIGVFPELTHCDNLNIFTEYAAIFGFPVSGQKVFFRVSLVNYVSGLRCVPLTFAAIVQ